MGENFYGREEEVRRQQERASHAHASHMTMETVQLENQAAQDDVEARAESAPRSAFERLKHALTSLFGRK